MALARRFLNRLRSTLRKSRIQEELQFHMDMEAEANVRRGMSEKDARAAATRAMGGAAQHAERYRDNEGFPLVDALIRDIRYGIRNLRSAPAFTATAILTLALGIGGTTAIFSIVNTVLLKPLPYADPDRLTLIWGHHPQLGLVASSMPDFLDLRARSRTADIAAYHRSAVDIISPGRPETFDGAAVSGNFFRVLATTPMLGQTPSQEREREPWLVLSHVLWQSRFGGDASVIGKLVSLSGTTATVVAVMPPDFDYPNGARAWTPLSTKAWLNDRRGDFLVMLGSLREKQSIASTQSELESITLQLQNQYPEANAGRTARVFSLHEELVKNTKTPLLVLFGAVGCLLLIACVNVANLLLARAISRGREMLVRTALGATCRRLILQLLIESLILSIIGALGGLLMAKAAVDALVRYSPTLLPRMTYIQVDRTALAFTLAVATATGLIFGLLPAFNAAKVDLANGLRANVRSVAAGTHTMRLLAVGEVAIAMCLLIGAGLLIRSLLMLTTVNPGYQPDHVLVARVSLNGKIYNQPGAVPSFHQRLLERIKALPGVINAATAGGPPARGGNYNTWIEEGETPRDDTFKEANFRGVSVEYLSTIGLSLLAGRNFEASDTANSERVVLVNSALARKYFGARNPLGRRIQADTEWRRIVGIVGDTRQEGLAKEAREEILFPMAQRGTRGVNLLVRTHGDPETLNAAVREAIASLDPELPLQLLTTLEKMKDADVAQPRFSTYLLATFAAVAALLAAIGVYGVTAYGVSLRSQEIGVRMALGADAARVRRTVLAGGLRLAIWGITFGAIVAAALAKTLTTLLFGVAPHDPAAFAAAAVMFIAVVAVASYLPARRATNIDPATILRAE